MIKVLDVCVRLICICTEISWVLYSSDEEISLTTPGRSAIDDIPSDGET